MTKLLQVGNKTYEYPSEGQEAGWGGDATRWAEAVTTALSTVQGPNDITVTTAILANNQAVAADIPGLIFDVSQILFCEVECLVERIYDSGATKISESFKILGNFDGSNFDIGIQSIGSETGINITALNTGQFQYTSSSLANHVSTTIRFKGRTIDT